MDSDDFEEIVYADAEDFAIKAYNGEGGLKGAVAGEGTVLLVRPFMTYNMASAILMKGGLETGFTAHGHHDFMLTDDVIHKVHIGHYTFYHKSVVKQPKNIVIAEDIFAHSYVSGEGTNMFKDLDTFKAQVGNDRFRGDLIPIWIPTVLGKIGKIENPLDLNGFYGRGILNDQNSELNDDQPHYPNAAEISKLYRFDEFNDHTSDERFLAPIRSLNTICFKGHCLSYDPKTDGHTKITINTGHWGPNVYPGCRSVRYGENTFLKDMEYAKYRVGQRLALK